MNTKNLLIVTILFLFAACKKNSSDGNSAIVGKWKQVSIYRGAAGDCNCWQDSDPAITTEIHFKSNGSYLWKEPSSSAPVCPDTDYSISGDSLHLGNSCGSIYSSAKFKIELASGYLIIDKLRGPQGTRFKFRKMLF
jgi:hypothetical protein